MVLENALDFTTKQEGFSVSNFIRIEIETREFTPSICIRQTFLHLIIVFSLLDIHSHSKNDRFTSFNDISLGNGVFHRRKKLFIPLLIGILLFAAAGIAIPLVISSMNDDSSSTSSTTTLSTMSSLDTSTSTMSSSTLATDVSMEPTTSALSTSTSHVSPTPKGTLMIVGGAVDNDNHPYKFADIIDLDNEDSDCQSAKYPLQAYDIQAGVVLDSFNKSKILFCGGIDEHADLIRNCYEYLNVSHGFHDFIQHTYAGLLHSSSAVQIHNGSDEQFLWITGGGEVSGGPEKSVQLVSTNGSVLDGPEMTESVSCHCAVAISDKAILVIGGRWLCLWWF